MKLNEKQLQQVDAQVKRLLKSGSFYGEVYRKAGICLLYSSYLYSWHAPPIA